MDQSANSSPAYQEDATVRLIESAASMGIEIDREDAERWIAALSAESFGSAMVDVSTGAHEHRLTAAEQGLGELERFRRMAAIVGFEDQPPVLMTALAPSGSPEQGRVQRFPADADFFQRVQIRASTRAEACRILAQTIRAKALTTLRGDGYRLHEVKFGTWPAYVTLAGRPVKSGQPVSWTPEQVEQGTIGFSQQDGPPGELRWEDAALEPGWCKLDWVITDRVDRALANVSNVLDPTWEAPDGAITPLGSFLDPYLRDADLETDSIPLVSRLASEMDADSVADYVERLTEEVYRYTVREPDYGKAARRMYNIFRLTGRYPEAGYIRELFNEPVPALYQVAALLSALDEADDAGDALESDGLVAQVDRLIMSAIAALEGRAESTMVRRLLRLRDAVSRREGRIGRTDDFVGVGNDALRAANAYLERALSTIPGIREYLDSIAASHHSVIGR